MAITPRDTRSDWAVLAAAPTAPAPAVSTAPSAPTTPTPPYPEADAPGKRDLLREYVAGGRTFWYASRTALATRLPDAIDDVTADFGDDLYTRMLRDPQIAASVAILKAAVLEQGPRLEPAIQDEADPDYEQAKTLYEEAVDMLADMDTSLDDVLWDLLDCVAYGNRVAEQVYAYEPAKTEHRRIYRVNRLKVKPRETVGFVVDQYMDLVGLVAMVPGIAVDATGRLYIDGAQDADPPPNLLGPEKFVIATFRPRNSDPRGTSVLRPAYGPWWRKQQIIPEYLKYLAQFAGPSIVGFTAENAQDVPDPADPAQRITPQQIMLAALQDLHNGTAAAFPYGAQIKEIAMQGEGAAFLRAIAHCDQQITKAVLTQELATEVSDNQARAAAQVHQEVLDTLVRQGKRHIVGILRRQMLQPWAVANWGPAARRLAPFVTLGDTLPRDQAKLWSAASQLMAQGYLAPDQMPKLDRQIGLPVREHVPVLAPAPVGRPGGPPSPPTTGAPARPAPRPGPGAPDPALNPAPAPAPSPTRRVSRRDLFRGGWDA